MATHANGKHDGTGKLCPRCERHALRSYDGTEGICEECWTKNWRLWHPFGMAQRGSKGSLQVSIADTRPPPPEEDAPPTVAHHANGSAAKLAKYASRWAAPAPGQTLGELAEHLRQQAKAERRRA